MLELAVDTVAPGERERRGRRTGRKSRSNSKCQQSAHATCVSLGVYECRCFAACWLAPPPACGREQLTSCRRKSRSWCRRTADHARRSLSEGARKRTHTGTEASSQRLNGRVSCRQLCPPACMPVPVSVKDPCKSCWPRAFGSRVLPPCASRRLSRRRHSCRQEYVRVWYRSNVRRSVGGGDEPTRDRRKSDRPAAVARSLTQTTGRIESTPSREERRGHRWSAGADVCALGVVACGVKTAPSKASRASVSPALTGANQSNPADEREGEQTKKGAQMHPTTNLYFLMSLGSLLAICSSAKRCTNMTGVAAKVFQPSPLLLVWAV